VVVGDLIGEGSAQEQSVVGETPNLAARLQALAEPGAVVIAASTRRPPYHIAKPDSVIRLQTCVRSVLRVEREGKDSAVHSKHRRDPSEAAGGSRREF
jgi:class 3 adenylate cyclase